MRGKMSPSRQATCLETNALKIQCVSDRTLAVLESTKVCFVYIKDLYLFVLSAEKYAFTIVISLSHDHHLFKTFSRNFSKEILLKQVGNLPTYKWTQYSLRGGTSQDFWESDRRNDEQMDEWTDGKNEPRAQNTVP